MGANFADLWESSPVDQFAGMKSNFAEKLKLANQAWESKTGKPLPMTSGYRTTEEQSKLFANKRNNPYPVAQPGTSKHEIGESADISKEVPDSFLSQYGLHRPYGAKDPVHVEANPNFKPKNISASSNGNFADLWESTPQIEESAQTKPSEINPFVKRDIEAVKEFVSTGKEFGKGVASLADIALGAVPAVVGGATYAGARALQQTPQEAQALAQKVSAPLESPVGKAFGITEEPAYKQEAGRLAMEKIGKYLGESADAISQKTGIPKSDVENMMGTISIALGKPIGKMVSVAKNVLTEPVRPLEVAKPLATEVVEPSKLKGVGAAKSELNPYPEFTGQENARGEFPQIKAEKMAGDVHPNEQTTRAEIINEINPNGRPRTGLITGNENTIRNEYTLANSSVESPAGRILKNEIANEQRALPEYAKKIVENTGADFLLPDNESRAMRIRSSLDSTEGLERDINTAKKSLYEEAFAKVGDTPVEASTIENLLNNKQFQAELKLKKLTDFTGGAKDLLELHKTEGFEGTLPGSIAGLEKLRQSLNAGWSPENSFAIRKAVSAIDEDIAKAGGVETYQKARALHAAEKNLFGSKGIKDLLTETDANGVQTGIPNEKLMQKLNNMPNDQWKHIYDTLGKTARGEIVGIQVSPEVQAAAKSAQAEMKGAIARDVYEAGAAKSGEWLPNPVNNKLNFHNSKIKHAFDPEEVRKLHTLNVGGYLMPAKNPYEGAGLQAQRVINLHEKLPAAGRIAGSMTRIPGAGMAGEWLGGKSSKLFKGRALRKEAEALDIALEKNKKLGTKLSDIGK